jgi:hypothetical protein
MSILHKAESSRTSVVTNLRNPLDRVLSMYEFSVEVAARFLRLKTSNATRRIVPRAKSPSQLVSTLSIWPWKYLVPFMQSDIFARVRKLSYYLPLFMSFIHYDCVIKLSSNSTWLLVKSWLFCIQEQRTIYMGQLRVKLILACQEVLKWVWSSKNRNRLLFIQNQILPHEIYWIFIASTTSGKKLLIWFTRQPLEYHRDPTTDK